MKSALAGGCSSPVRSGWAVGGEPFVQSRGDGAYAFDENGQRYVDYIMAYGPLLFGYNHRALTVGLEDVARRGVLFGSSHAEEARLAERIREHIPAMQSVRFTTTGSEATMSAVRLARAFTGRDLIVRFAGNYHGHYDAALFSAGASASAGGIPAGVMSDVAIARYNDLSSVDVLLADRQNSLAAIVVEPICANMGLVLPVHGFLTGLRTRCDRYGALLIFDEIITWPRIRGAGGGVAADLVTIGKILGGGFPIAAFGGRDDVMAMLAPGGDVFTGGTHAGNPFAVAMAHRIVDLIEAHPEEFTHMEVLARRLADGIRLHLARLSLPYTVLQRESIVDFKFRAGPANRNYDDARAADASQYARYYHAMRARRILLPPSQNEVMFLSTAHTAEDIDETLIAIGQSLEQA